MIGELPRSLIVNEIEHPIRTDFRDILKIVCAFSDPELTPREKAYVCLLILYEDFDELDQSDYEQAFKIALRFIDNGFTNDDKRPAPSVMDWEQDANIMFPAINKVAGFEVRTVVYIHWWTFLGYYMEIHDGVYANVLSMRIKRAKHKKLEKWEQEYWNANKSICVLKQKLTEEEQAAKERLNKMLN